MLHASLDHQYFFVQSDFKIDFTYKSDNDLSKYFIKQLLKLAGKPLKSGAEIPKYFYRKSGRQEVLEAYFIRLYHFSQIASFLDASIERFNLVVQENPQNAITKEIVSCFKHIKTTPFRPEKDYFEITLPSTLANPISASLRLL